MKRFFKDVTYLFCCQEHLKYFLENYGFCRKSGKDAYSKNVRRGSCYLRHYDALRTESDV